MEPLLLSILGDILTFDNGASFTQRERFTKSKYGDKFKLEGRVYTIRKFFLFLNLGGVNRDLSDQLYSFNTTVIYSTLRALNNKTDSFESACIKEYSKLYTKYSSKDEPNRLLIPFNYLNSFSNLITHRTPYNPNANDLIPITRIIPIALLYWKKDKTSRNNLVETIIRNIILTHNNVKCYLSAITLGLFISYGKNGINSQKWCHNLVEYLLSDELDSLVKKLELHNNTFIIEREQYVTMWNNYIGLHLKKMINSKFWINHINPGWRYEYLYYLSDNFNNLDEFTYGRYCDDGILCAYDTLLCCQGSWEKLILSGCIGTTDNSTMATICGALFGAEYKFESVWIEKYLKEDWVKKALKLGKSLGL